MRGRASKVLLLLVVILISSSIVSAGDYHIEMPQLKYSYSNYNSALPVCSFGAEATRKFLVPDPNEFFVHGHCDSLGTIYASVGSWDLYKQTGGSTVSVPEETNAMLAGFSGVIRGSRNRKLLQKHEERNFITSKAGPLHHPSNTSSQSSNIELYGSVCAESMKANFFDYFTKFNIEEFIVSDNHEAFRECTNEVLVDDNYPGHMNGWELQGFRLADDSFSKIYPLPLYCDDVTFSVFETEDTDWDLLKGSPKSLLTGSNPYIGFGDRNKKNKLTFSADWSRDSKKLNGYSIEIDDSSGMSGGFKFKVTCDRTESPYNSPDKCLEVQGDPMSDLSAYGCCFYETLGKTTTLVGQNTLATCEITNGQYNWNVEGPVSCGPDDNPGTRLKDDAPESYCCNTESNDYNQPHRRPESFWHNAYSKYFCADGLETSGEPIGENKEWLNHSNTWNECTASLKGDVSLDPFLCTIIDDEYTWKECSCTSEEGGIGCEIDVETGRKCWVDAADEPTWTLSALDACQEDQKVNGKCCTAGVYDIDVTEGRWCFGGTLARKTSEFGFFDLGESDRPHLPYKVVTT